MIFKMVLEIIFTKFQIFPHNGLAIGAIFQRKGITLILEPVLYPLKDMCTSANDHAKNDKQTTTRRTNLAVSTQNGMITNRLYICKYI